MGGEQGQLHLTILGIDRPLDPQMIDEMRPQEAQKNHEQKQRLPARGLENLSGDQPQSKHRQILIMIVSGGKPHPSSAGCALVSKGGTGVTPILHATTDTRRSKSSSQPISSIRI